MSKKLKLALIPLSVFLVAFLFFNQNQIKNVWAYFVGPAQKAATQIGVCTVSATFVDFCVAPLQPVLSWQITAGSQTQYAIQVDDNGGTTCGAAFPSPEADSGTVSSSSTSYTVPNGLLSYGKTYYWQVAAANGTAWTGWVPHDVSFSTPLHQWPTANFSWNPSANLRAESEVQFLDQSTVYGGAAKSNWSWTFQDATPATSTQQNPVVFFNSSGTKQVSLTITDSDGYYCSINKSVTVDQETIDWQEVLPR